MFIYTIQKTALICPGKSHYCDVFDAIVKIIACSDLIDLKTKKSIVSGSPFV